MNWRSSPDWKPTEIRTWPPSMLVSSWSVTVTPGVVSGGPSTSLGGSSSVQASGVSVVSTTGASLTDCTVTLRVAVLLGPAEASVAWKLTVRVAVLGATVSVLLY